MTEAPLEFRIHEDDVLGIISALNQEVARWAGAYLNVKHESADLRRQIERYRSIIRDFDRQRRAA